MTVAHRVYRTYYLLGLAFLFLFELAMPSGINFPFLYVGIVIMPLFFERFFAFFWAGVWGIVMGGVSHNNLFFHLCVYMAAVAVISFSIRHLQLRLLVYGVASVLAAIVYVCSVMIFGAYVLTGMVSIFISIGVACFGAAFILGRFMRHEDD